MARRQDAPVRVKWDQVLAWRMRRQHLDPPDGAGAVEITRRLCGIQAQLPAAASLAVAIRQSVPDLDAAASALADRRLIRTWAMRGTLHLLAPDQAPGVLSLLGASRTWEKPSWQRSFVTAGQLSAMAGAVTQALDDGSALTREQLTERVLAETGDQALAEQMRSGWSAVLKPLAWQGLIFQGPTIGNRITFVRPDRWLAGWPGLPDPDDAAGAVIESYLSAFGPAGPATFDQWLLRGATSKPTVRRWFNDLGERITPVDVEGTGGYLRTADLDELLSVRPHPVVRLLPAFDQFVLGPGTADPQLIPAQHRAEVSRAAGWIAPVIVSDGRVTGTWSATDGRLELARFPRPSTAPPPTARTAKRAALLEQEVRRVRTLLG